MDHRIKAKWIKALRSGKFKQARGKLLNTKTGGMCCLGVGARVVDRKFDLVGNPTFAAASILGLNGNEQQTLVDLNDYQRKNFKTIADFIAKNL